MRVLSVALTLITVLSVGLADDPSQPLFYGKSALLNIGPNSFVQTNGTAGIVASVDISSLNELTFEFWLNPEQIFFTTGLVQGPAFFLGNNLTYIRLSTINTTTQNPTRFCFTLMIVENGVTKHTTVDPSCSLDPNFWHHISVGMTPTSGYITIRQISFQTTVVGLVSNLTIPFNHNITFSAFTNSKMYIGAYEQSMSFVPAAWGGRIDEIRIWSEFRSSSLIEMYYTSGLTGQESNLVAYYNFDDDSQHPKVIDLTPNRNDGTFFDRKGNTPPNTTYHIWDYYYYPRSYTGCCLPLVAEYKNIPHNGSYSFSTCTLDDNWGVSAFALPSSIAGSLCNASTCPQDLSFTISSGNCIPLVYNPSRDACGTQQLISIKMMVNYNNITSYTNNTVHLNVSRYLPDINGNYSISPLGGSIDISVGGIGTVLGTTEFVTIETQFGGFNCTKAINGGMLNCQVPPGVGTGTVTAKLCGQVVTAPFAYNAPFVYNVNVDTVNSTLQLEIIGDNFASSNSFPFTYVYLEDHYCYVSSWNNTIILCNIYVQIPSGNLKLNVTVGGQKALYSLSYECTSCQVTSSTTGNTSTSSTSSTGYVSTSSTGSTSSTSSSALNTSNSKPVTNNSTAGIIGGVVGGVVLVAIIVVAMVFLLRKRNKISPKSSDVEMKTTYGSLGKVESISNYSAIKTVEPIVVAKATSLTKSLVIPYSDLQMDKELGSGSFGVVYVAEWRNQRVAGKFSEEEVRKFEDEANLMSNLRPHKNVILFLGVCVNPMCIVVEFYKNGSLWDYMKSKPLTLENKMNILKGIAAGMVHLHKEGVVHRDLAARNILLNGDLDAVVSDFGFARVVAKEYNKTTSDVGPLRWMAPESLQSRIYSKQTDIWAFGVTAWEVLSNGDVPYGEDVLPFEAAMVKFVVICADVKAVLNGSMRLKMPSDSPMKLTELVERCFSVPENRPSFQDLFNEISSMNK